MLLVKTTTTMLTLATVLTLACYPDQPQFAVAYRNAEKLAASHRELATCLPAAASSIEVHYDRRIFGGTTAGTFRFDVSEVAGSNARPLPATGVRLPRRRPDQTWWPVNLSSPTTSQHTFYGCRDSRFVLALDRASGSGVFWLQ